MSLYGLAPQLSSFRVGIDFSSLLFSGKDKSCPCFNKYAYGYGIQINNFEPFDWLKNNLTILPDYPARQLHKLLTGH